MSKVLVLRTCKSDLTSRNGFQWPASGHVIAPDWDPKPECGHGLHGALWGVGDGFLFNWEPDAKWLVVEVESESIVDLGGKVKFPEGVVVFSGSRYDATQYLQARLPPGSYPVIGSTVTSGFDGTSTSGYMGTSTSGNGGTSTSGDYGTSTSGDYGTSTSGNGGTSTSGNYGISTSGDYGTSTSGDYGTSTSGYRGTSISGTGGESISGIGGTVISGDEGTISLDYLVKDSGRVKTMIGYIGEDGLEPYIAYILDENNNFRQSLNPKIL